MNKLAWLVVVAVHAPLCAWAQSATPDTDLGEATTASEEDTTSGAATPPPGRRLNLSEHLEPPEGAYALEAAPGTGTWGIRGLSGGRIAYTINGVRVSTATAPTFGDRTPSWYTPAFFDEVRVDAASGALTPAPGALGTAVTWSTWNWADPPAPHLMASALMGTAAKQTAAGLLGGVHGERAALTTGLTAHTFGEQRSGDGDKDPLSQSERAHWLLQLHLEPEDSPFTVTGGYMGAAVHDAWFATGAWAGNVDDADTADHLVFLNLDWRPTEQIAAFWVRAGYHQNIDLTTHTRCSAIPSVHQDLYDCALRADGAAAWAERQRTTVDSFSVTTGATVRSASRRFSLMGTMGYYFDNVISSGRWGTDTGSGMSFTDDERGLFTSGSYFSAFHAGLRGTAVLWRSAVSEFTASLGGRGDVTGAYAPVVAGPDEDIHRQTAAFSDEASLQWRSGDVARIDARFAQSVRPASLHDLSALGFSGPVYATPNPEVQPEVANLFSVRAQLGMDPVRFTATWFRNRIDDYIDVQPTMWTGRYDRDGVPVVHSVNAHKALIEGVEAGLTVTLYTVTLANTVAWLDATVHGTPTGFMAELVHDATSWPALAVPKLWGRSSLTCRDAEDRFYAGVYVDYAAAQDALHPLETRLLSTCAVSDRSAALRASCPGTAGWYTLNARAGFAVTPLAWLDVAARNLTDVDYRPVGWGHDAPGIDVRADLTVAF